MPYLEVNQGNKEEIENVEEIEAPDLVGKTLIEAQKVAKENEIDLVIEDEREDLDKENSIVKEQVPRPGIKIHKESKIYIKYE